MAIATGSITIMSYDDATVLTSYINSNTKKTQLLNPDTNKLTPDWENDNVILTPSLYLLGSTEDLFNLNGNVSNDIERVTWYVNNNKIDLSINSSNTNNDSNYYSLTGSKNHILTIKKNTISEIDQSVEYSCDIIYKENSLEGLRIVQKSDIIFQRISNGGGLSGIIIELPNGNVFKNNNDTSLKALATFYRNGNLIENNLEYKWYLRDTNSIDPIAGNGWKSLIDTNGSYTGCNTNELTIYSSIIDSFEVFKVSVKDIDSSNSPLYWNTVSFIDNTDPIQTVIFSSNGEIFKNGQVNTKLKAKLYRRGEEEDISNNSSYTYRWSKYTKDGIIDNNFNGTGFKYKNGKEITILNTDILEKSTFLVEVLNDNKIFSSNQITLIDLNDITGSKTPPTDKNTAWLDTNLTPPVLKVWNSVSNSWIVQNDWKPITDELFNKVDIKERTKLMGVELFDQTYKLLETINIFPDNVKGNETGQYAVEYNINYSLSQNVIKLNNSCNIKSYFYRYIDSYPFYISLEYLNKLTSNGNFQIILEYYNAEKNKLDADEIIFNQSSITDNILSDSWNNISCFAEISTNDLVKKQCSYVKFAFKNRVDNLLGITYLKNISIKQLGNTVGNAKGETWINTVSDLVIKSDEINAFVKEQKNQNLTTSNRLDNFDEELLTTSNKIASINLKSDLINLSLIGKTEEVYQKIENANIDGRNLYNTKDNLLTSSDNYIVIDIHNIIKDYINENMTFSFDLKTTSNNTTNVISINGKYGISESKTVSSTTEFNRVSYSGKIVSLTDDTSITNSKLFITSLPNTIVPTIKNIKIEIGLNDTGWVPSPEDVVDNVVSMKKTIKDTETSLKLSEGKIESIVSSTETIKNTANSALDNANKAQSDVDNLKNTVDNIQIGGRNLLLKYDIKINESPFVTNNKYQNLKILYSNYIYNTNSFTDVVKWDNVLNIKPNTYYTLSFYIKGTGIIGSYFYNTTGIIVNGSNSKNTVTTSKDGDIKFNVSNEWERYTVTWLTKDTISNEPINIIPIRQSGSSSEIWACGFKFEEGNKATDWTLAPEDINQDIQDVLDTANTLYNKTDCTVLKKQLEVLNKENSDVNERYSLISTKLTSIGSSTDNIIIDNVTLTKIKENNDNNLTLLNNYIGSYTEDDYITTAEETYIQTCLNNFIITSKKLHKYLEEANNVIANKLVNNLDTKLSQDIQDVLDTANTLYNKTDCTVLKKQLEVLSKENNDVIERYNQINSKLTSLDILQTSIIVSGVNLTTAYNNNNSYFSTLSNNINSYISDNKITTDESNTLNTNITNYINASKVLHSLLEEANNVIANKLVDNVQIGGRNLLKNTVSYIGWGAGGCTITLNQTDPYNSNKAILINGNTTTNSYLLLEGTVLKQTGFHSLSVWLKGTKAGNVYVGFNLDTSTNSGRFLCNLTTKWKRFTFTSDEKTIRTTYKFILGGWSSWTDLSLGVYMAFPMLCIGNKPMDWTPAPEDVDSSINDLDVKYNTKVTQLNDRITTTVSSNETNLSTLNSRISTVEQNITPTALTTTISSAISDANGNLKISNNKVTIDKNGLTVDGGGFKVTNVSNGILRVSNGTLTFGNKITDTELDTTLKSTIDTTKTTANTALTNANKAQSDIDGLEVGGRNLFSKSNIAQDIDSTKDFSLNGWAAAFMNNQNVLRTLEEGKTYTLSYDVELIERTNVPDLYACQAGLYLYSPSTANDVQFPGVVRELNDKVRIEKTFVCPPLSDQIFIYYTNRYTTGGSNPIGFDTIKITNLKLEKGNKATDWTPAPEDIDSSISTVNNRIDTSIETLATSINNKLTSEYFVKEDINNFLDELKKADDDNSAIINSWKDSNDETLIGGSMIATGTLLGHQIIGNTLSAIKGKLGDVEVGSISSPGYSEGKGMRLDFNSWENCGMTVTSTANNTTLKIDSDGTRVYNNSDLQNPVAKFVENGVEVRNITSNTGTIAGLQFTKIYNTTNSSYEVWITSIN